MKGEPEAFSAFYKQHAKDVLPYFAHRTFDADTAADITAETFASERQPMHSAHEDASTHHDPSVSLVDTR